jgi:hypothetical protein
MADTTIVAAFPELPLSEQHEDIENNNIISGLFYQGEE